MKQYAAGIVLYNPEIKRLKANIDSIYRQVELVYCFDNGSNNLNEVQVLLSSYSNVLLIKSPQNLGIAVALNRIGKELIKKDFKWLLALDQDTVSPINMVEEFSKFVDYKDVAIICPNVIDKRMNKNCYYDQSVTYVDYCITSGSLLNLKIFQTLNGFDEYLFVGCIDDEYSYRLILNDYKILKINYLFLDQEFGVLLPKKNAKFWIKLGDICHINKIKSLSYKRIIAPIRFYYLSRNYLYLSKKYRLYPNNNFGYCKIIYEDLSAVFRGNNKKEIIKAIIAGLKDGYKVKVKAYEIERK